MKETSYTYRRSGTCGCEILDADGAVIAWTVNAEWAGRIVVLLNTNDYPRPARCHLYPDGSGQVEAGQDRGGLGPKPN